MGGSHSSSAVHACEPVVRAFDVVVRHISSDSSLVRLVGPLRTILNSYIPTDGELVEAVRVVLAGSWSISVGDCAVKTGAVISCSELTKTFFVSRAFFEMAYDNEIEADRMAVVAIIGLCHAICEIITVTLAQAQSTSAVPTPASAWRPTGCTLLITRNVRQAAVTPGRTLCLTAESPGTSIPCSKVSWSCIGTYVQKSPAGSFVTASL
jgi:hypothetical protein